MISNKIIRDAFKLKSDKRLNIVNDCNKCNYYDDGPNADDNYDFDDSDS